MIAGIRYYWKILRRTLVRVYCKQPECVWGAESCEVKQKGWLILLRFSASGDAFVVCRVCCDCRELTATQPFPSSYSPGEFFVNPLSINQHSLNYALRYVSHTWDMNETQSLLLVRLTTGEITYIASVPTKYTDAHERWNHLIACWSLRILLLHIKLNTDCCEISTIMSAAPKILDHANIRDRPDRIPTICH